MTGAVETIYETFDGVRLVYRAKKLEDGKTWVTLNLEPAGRWAGLDAFLEANKGKDTESGRIADQFKTSEEVAAEIEKWSASASGWAYRLTDYKTKRLTARTPDVIAKPDAKQGQPQQ
jgi:hypothetical protein